MEQKNFTVILGRKTYFSIVPVHSKIDMHKNKMVGWLVWLLLYAHRQQRILGAAGHIILTLANQLMKV
jgi:hypothetical protein